MKHRDGLNDLDDRAEDRQANDQPENRETRERPRAKHAQRGECGDVLDLVGGMPRKFGRVRKHRHDEGEERRRPEQQARQPPPGMRFDEVHSV